MGSSCCAPRPLFLPVGVTAPCSGRGRLPLGLCWGICQPHSLPFLTCLCPGGGCSGVFLSWPCSVTTGPLCLAFSFPSLNPPPLKVSHLPAAQTFQAHHVSCSPYVFQGSAVPSWSRGSFSWDTRVGHASWHAVEFCRPAGQQGYSVFVNVRCGCSLRSGQGIGSIGFIERLRLYQLSWLIFIRPVLCWMWSSTVKFPCQHLVFISDISCRFCSSGLLWYLICTYL